MAKVDHRRLGPATLQVLKHEILKTFRQCGLTRAGEGLLLHLLTTSEIVMVARRLQIARLLLQGRSPASIARTLKVSRNTVSDVETWLSDQSDYPMLFSEIRKEGGIKNDTLRMLCKRYPAKMLFVRMLLENKK